MMITTKPQEVEQTSTVVIYDSDTGEIVHKHECVTLAGGRHPDKKTLERDALENAASAGRDTSRTGILHVTAEALSPNKLYKVDTQRRALVEAPGSPSKKKR